MNDLLSKLTQKKQKLDSFRPLSLALVNNLDEWFKVELTYTSNAIEGNTLTRKETALVVEEGITVRGKTLKEHLEAINHAQALDFIKDFVGKKREDLTKRELLGMHGLILKKIDDDDAGKYRNVAVRIKGTDVILPNPLKVPELMDSFFEWLHGKNNDHPVKIAADAHIKLVSIHPFLDGNGRTARLLMNLLLMQKGYPPALVRKEDREAYIDSIQKAQLNNNFKDYYKVIYKAIDRSLDIYLDAVEGKTPTSVVQKRLLRIGELAEETGETLHSIRHWLEKGLLEVAEHTRAGYQLFDRSMIEKVKEIRRLQREERLTIEEIKNRLES
ncbi:MAG: cell filamentation protein Fic [Candidatus Levybacteria bacterium RBG_16_35_11]|nr:MAG: cell filamentation protein Fic [Candidatus Levybacteria bacterium RBG_16_35_11]